MSKPLVIYHKSCADGFGAAFAAWLKLGDEAEYIAYAYGEEADSFDTTQVLNREVYILDFSFKKPIMDVIMETADKVVWLDHHKTAFEMWGVQLDTVYEERTPTRHTTLDNDKSGAMLSFDYFFPDQGDYPLLFNYIDDYDRWQFKIPGTKEFSRALWSYAPWTFQQWFDMNLLEDKACYDLQTEGKAILRAHKQNVDAVVKYAARKCMIWIPRDDPYDERNQYEWEGLVANCPPFLTSDVGHELAVQSGTFGLLWTMGQDDKIKCSLRSNGDYDVSAIAKQFGGGGHKNAAGFETDLSMLLTWIL